MSHKLTWPLRQKGDQSAKRKNQFKETSGKGEQSWLREIRTIYKLCSVLPLGLDLAADAYGPLNWAKNTVLQQYGCSFVFTLRFFSLKYLAMKGLFLSFRLSYWRFCDFFFSRCFWVVFSLTHLFISASKSDGRTVPSSTRERRPKSCLCQIFIPSRSKRSSRSIWTPFGRQKRRRGTETTTVAASQTRAFGDRSCRSGSICGTRTTKREKAKGRRKSKARERERRPDTRFRSIWTGARIGTRVHVVLI